MIEIAIMGHGVVGSGVAELLIKNRVNIAKKAGDEIHVKYILDLREFPGCCYEEKFTKDFGVILSDSDVKIVVEAMGGVCPAYDYVSSCLEAGKSVVTSNKELVAKNGARLLELAADNNVNFLFEASVGGGIPIIRPLHQCLAANEIDEISGILNGTTNFILTKMFKEGMAFDEALETARKLGYAESDPSADVDGHDTCRKICILASIAFGSHVYPECVPTEGIRGITSEDVQYAESAGAVIKLIGRARRIDDCKAYILVSPVFVPYESQLSSVDDVFNAILVRGDSTGDVVFYGKGAGKLPTASAVIGDVLDCAVATGNIGSLHWIDSEKDNVTDAKTEPCVMYVRCEGMKTAVYDAFGDVKFLSRPNQPSEEVAFITPLFTEYEIEKKLDKHGFKTLAKLRILESE